MIFSRDYIGYLARRTVKHLIDAKMITTSDLKLVEARVAEGLTEEQLLERILQGYRDRDGLDWSDHRLKAIDIQWSDIRPEKGLFQRLYAKRTIQRVGHSPRQASAGPLAAAISSPQRMARRRSSPPAARRSPTSGTHST